MIVTHRNALKPLHFSVPIFSLCFSVALLVTFTACASAPKHMEFCRTQKVLREPPKGMALVNFHEPPSFMSGEIEFPIFDREEFIGALKGNTWFQYTCEPGEHVFVINNKGFRGEDSVLVGNLGVDRVYDIVVAAGIGYEMEGKNSAVWAATTGAVAGPLGAVAGALAFGMKDEVHFIPITKDYDKREQVMELKSKGRLLAINGEHNLTEKEMKRIGKIMDDFLEGPKKPLLRYLNEDDCQQQN